MSVQLKQYVPEHPMFRNDPRYLEMRAEFRVALIYILAERPVEEVYGCLTWTDDSYTYSISLNCIYELIAEWFGPEEKYIPYPIFHNVRVFVCRYVSDANDIPRDLSELRHSLKRTSVRRSHFLDRIRAQGRVDDADELLRT